MKTCPIKIAKAFLLVLFISMSLEVIAGGYYITSPERDKEYINKESSIVGDER